MNEMQKLIKYSAIAFAIFLIFNIFVGIYSIGMFVGNIFFDSSHSEVLKIDEFSDDVSILSIDIKASKLIIKNGDTLKVENNNKYINSHQDHNKVEIVEKKHYWFSHNDSEVIVYIPDDMIFDKLYISSGAGVINAEELSTKELVLELGAGKIEIDDLEAKNNAKISSGAGEVIINSGEIRNLDLDVGVGKFTLNTILTGDNEIEAGVGELNVNLLDNEENYTILAEKGIGDLKIAGKSYGDKITYGTGKSKIEIDGGIGSINVNFK